jgi:hypothetical protein
MAAAIRSASPAVSPPRPKVGVRGAVDEVGKAARVFLLDQPKNLRRACEVIA